MVDLTDEPVTIDASLALAARVTGGVTDDAIRARRETAAAAVRAVRHQVEDGTLGFWGLPDGGDAVSAVHAAAARLRDMADTLVVLGIGGSCLGGQTVEQALCGESDKRVLFVDNVDPVSFDRMLAGLDLSRTVFNVISKSGGTVETAAEFVLVRDVLKRTLGEDAYKARVLATTDLEKGLMRTIALRDGLSMLGVPDNVGGRFSVLTAVGLLPAAFAGVDIDAMLAGAASMRARCSGEDIADNAALALAVLMHSADVDLGRNVHVMMPYSDRLRAFSAWFVQLWAESLGKAVNKRGEAGHVGPTPLVAVGATDQHAQMQLFMEGPQDKLLTFIAAHDAADPVPFPEDLPEEYAYLRGHTMAGLLDAERRGTTLALAKMGRPSITLHVPAVNAHALGELFFLYEAATAFAGELYDVNAFDQPGVELGKRLAFGLMGRDGYADDLKGLDAFEDGLDGWTFSG